MHQLPEDGCGDREVSDMKRIIIRIAIVIIGIVLALLMARWIWSWDIPEWLKIYLIAS